MLNETTERRPGFYGRMGIDTSMPVVILGGKENALSLVRSLGRLGISVSVSGPDDCWALGSKFCMARYPVLEGMSPKKFWTSLLLGDDATITTPHVILPCCDMSLEFVAEHEVTLRKRFVFDGADAAQRLALLDKQRTLELAADAGTAAPKFWPVAREFGSDDEFEGCQFPLIVKPKNTFAFAKVFGRKFFLVQDSPVELRQRIQEAHDHGFDVSVVEQIPGPDDLLSSYYTYIDETGTPLFHFTKRVFRRYPVNSGGATYHTTEWLPETAQEGLKFFRNTGFRGLGNIEFKRDPRDGKLKIIEVNARFTAAEELAVQAGAPIDLIVYCHLTGQPVPTFEVYEADKRFWYPVKDFLSFLQMRQAGQLGLRGWVSSLNFSRHVSPLFDLSDLKPGVTAATAIVHKVLAGRKAAWGGR
jgi:D-aspartate ligase